MDKNTPLAAEQSLFQYLLENSRDFTKEEQTLYQDALKRMSTPTGVSLLDAFAAIPEEYPITLEELFIVLDKVKEVNNET